MGLFFLKLAEKLSHSFLFSELGEYYSHDIQYTDCVTPFSFSLKKTKQTDKTQKMGWKSWISLQNIPFPSAFIQWLTDWYLHKSFFCKEVVINLGLSGSVFTEHRTCILRVNGINPILQKQFPSLFRTLKVLLSIFCVHDLLKTIDLYFILLLLLFTKFGYNQLNTRFWQSISKLEENIDFFYFC